MKESEFHAATPMDMLFAKAKMTCTMCGAKAWTCDCWIKCACGWSYYKTESHCGNRECITARPDQY